MLILYHTPSHTSGAGYRDTGVLFPASAAGVYAHAKSWARDLYIVQKQSSLNYTPSKRRREANIIENGRED